MPGGLDVLSDSGPGFRASRGRGEAVLHLGGSARHPGTRPERALRDRQPVGYAHALVNGKVVELRVPYPMGFFAKGLDGRIDDPKAGWKGRGIWATSGNRTPMHIEGMDAPASRRTRRPQRPYRAR